MSTVKRTGLKVLTGGENRPGSHLAANLRTEPDPTFEKGPVLMVKKLKKISIRVFWKVMPCWA
jgi:hypothetical protein